MSRTPRKKTGSGVLGVFHPAVRRWFEASFTSPTLAQEQGFGPIARGESTLILAPTGSGKTLTAFLWAIDRIMFSPLPAPRERCRVVYVSPLKALAVDVERNLRAPIAGIAAIARGSEDFVLPSIAIRTGDTPPRERARFQREPADILITTPESLYLLLTSNARNVLRSVDTIIVDEIHALVPTKRGAHLALSLERLQRLCERPPQRIGLSATQRPLEEVARFLGGVARVAPPAGGHAALQITGEEHPGPAPATEYRAVTVVDTGERKRLDIRVEVPVEDMARLGEAIDIPSGPASSGAVHASIWPAIHPRLLELIRAHSSTLIFVNSRRLAERLAAALNELAGETLVRAHHGSIAREQRMEIEDELKSGRLPALVATSSLELGIDMGAIDLVVQIEAPPSIASGMQRIGRASHRAGEVSKGVIFPKYRGDLVASAAISEAMLAGKIEATAYPRNPLDVLAQQIVAMVAMEEWVSEALFDAVRRAAPFADLSRAIFDGVLDMLSGVYPSDEFAELRPRVTWNRIEDTLVARPGARSLAVVNGGTIPDRGLFGVFLAGAESRSARVGELDEEMVFESSAGETFVLGASTWRIEEISHDRVLVSPAPGEPGKTPFWHGDSAGRSVELGEQIGVLLDRVLTLPRTKAVKLLLDEHRLDRLAAENLLAYVEEQKEATGKVADAKTVVIERCLDEMGDWRVCVLSPLGGRVHAPWAMAVAAKVRRELAIEVETMWSDDGFVVRFPETDTAPDPQLLLPDSDELQDLVLRQLGATSLFAAKFRESAARALLLPRRRPGTRAPLWQQRKRAYDLLQVASRFGSFPMLLEAYRECLVDVFDMPSLSQVIRNIEQRVIRVETVDTETPSPFASSLLFRYVANYIYDGDAPLAERRAQALSIDQAQLRELLGDAELRELLDPGALEQTERRLQRLEEGYRAKNMDAIHDLLLAIGDLTAAEIAERSVSAEVGRSVRTLVKDRRAVEVSIAGRKRFIAVEDSGRYRDALGVPLPTGIPERLLQPVADPLGDLVLRYARTHGPFTTSDVAHRYGVAPASIDAVLRRFEERGRILEGEFLPHGSHREWCETEVLRTIRRASLARLRHEIEPAEPRTYARLLPSWQGVTKPRPGMNALLEAVELLQGYPIAASILETEILSSRIADYRESDLDTLAAAGEIVWVGVEPVGERDGRIALFLADQARLLLNPREPAVATELEQRVLDLLGARGALFFDQIVEQLGGFPADTIDAIWSLVWRGLVTNDSFHALRSLTRPKSPRRAARPGFRSRRASVALPASEGRWSLVSSAVRGADPTDSERGVALAQQMLNRYGVVVREAMPSENVRGGFSTVYEVLKRMEERGRVRRGYFVGGLAATQFASPSALDLLRSLRLEPDAPESAVVAASDVANPYGTILKWPAAAGGRTLTRSVGAKVVLVNGWMSCYVTKGEKELFVFLPEGEPARGVVGAETARALAQPVREGKRRAVLVTEVNGQPTGKDPFAQYLIHEGFVQSASGFQFRARPEETDKGSERGAHLARRPR